MAQALDTFSGRTQYRLRVQADLLQQDIPNNRSQIRERAWIDETTEWGSFSFDPATWSMRAPSATVRQSSSPTYDFRNYNTLALGDVTFWIDHAADGQYNSGGGLVFRGIFGGGTVIGSADATGTLAIPRIPRGPRVRSAGVWRNTVAYVKSGGVWKVAIPYVKSGTWKVGGG